MSRYDDKPGAWCTTCQKRTHNTAECWGVGTVSINTPEARAEYERMLARPGPPWPPPMLVGEFCTIPWPAP